MIRKTKFEKLRKSYTENMLEFFTKYLKFEKSRKTVSEDMTLSDLTDIIVEDTVQMRNLIRDAVYAVLSANDYIESLENKMKKPY